MNLYILKLRPLLAGIEVEAVMLGWMRARGNVTALLATAHTTIDGKVNLPWQRTRELGELQLESWASYTSSTLHHAFCLNVVRFRKRAYRFLQLEACQSPSQSHSQSIETHPRPQTTRWKNYLTKSPEPSIASSYKRYNGHSRQRSEKYLRPWPRASSIFWRFSNWDHSAFCSTDAINSAWAKIKIPLMKDIQIRSVWWLTC